MPNQVEALAILNREKAYEDNLVQNLDTYFIGCLDGISNLSIEDKKNINKTLTIIMNDSMRHSSLFNDLILMVLEHGENNY